MPGDERRLAEGIVARALEASPAPETEVTVSGSTEALTRFAGSAIHQNLSRSLLTVSLRACDAGRTGRATTTRTDPAALARASRSALEIARSVEPSPDALPLPGPLEVPELRRWDPAIAAQTPEQRAAGVEEICRQAAEARATAAGAFSSGAHFTCLGTSRGHLAYGEYTSTSLSATLALDGSSGYSEQSGFSVAAIHPMFLGLRAASKAARGRRRVELPPGRYTAILEPSAVGELMYFLLFGHGVSHWSALGVSEGRSFVSKRMGSRIFGENVTIRDDPWHPLQYGLPFDAEGIPRRSVTLVERGVAKELTCDRVTAARLGLQPTGHGLPIPNPLGSAPMNLVMDGGKLTIEEMVARCEHGILVTRVWYIRLVDPADLIVTGLTRDGTFLVENGRITSAVRNFRFNQSLREMLCRIAAASPAERAAGMVVPALTVEGFHFSSAVPDDPSL